MPDMINFGLQIASTLVLYVIVRRFLWAPMQQFLQARQALVSKEITEANNLKAEALTLKQSAEASIQVARDEAREIVDNSKKQATNMHNEIVAKAKEEAASKLAKAEADIEQQRKAVYATIREDVVTLAVTSAEKIIEKEINEKTHTELFNQLVTKVGGAHE